MKFRYISCLLLALASIGDVMAQELGPRLCGALFAREAPRIIEMKQPYQEVHKSMYASDRCYLNIWQLIYHAASEYGVSMENARVLYVLPRENLRKETGHVYAALNRRNLPEAWQFHVVLEREGLIYDPDFGSAPVALPMKDYFEKMFGDAQNDIFVREVPARAYLFEYQKFAADGRMKDSSYFQLRADEYRTEPLRDFLGRIAR